MIVLRTPKGWTGPKEVDGHKVEGFWRAHQVPLAGVRENPAHLKLLEDWLRSYRPQELFDERGRLIPELRALAPTGTRRMGANPHANGGLLRKTLRLPDFRQYAIQVEKPGQTAAENTRPLGRFLRDIMMNGALTIGTRDGATIEMAEEAGEENFFLFGLTADQVVQSRGWYSPQWHYDNETETRAALDLIRSDHFSRYEPGVFSELHDTLLAHGDHYLHLADLKSYLEADQRLLDLYSDQDAWTRKAILNVASSGKFSTDRTIAEYAADIWNVKPCS